MHFVEVYPFYRWSGPNFHNFFQLHDDIPTSLQKPPKYNGIVFMFNMPLFIWMLQNILKQWCFVFDVVLTFGNMWNTISCKVLWWWYCIRRGRLVTKMPIVATLPPIYVDEANVDTSNFTESFSKRIWALEARVV